MPIPSGVGAGTSYDVGELKALDRSELHTFMFIYPDGVNPSPFPTLEWLFSTATNRTDS